MPGSALRAFSGLCSLMAYLSARERKLFAIEPSRHQQLSASLRLTTTTKAASETTHLVEELSLSRAGCSEAGAAPARALARARRAGTHICARRADEDARAARGAAPTAQRCLGADTA